MGSKLKQQTSLASSVLKRQTESRKQRGRGGGEGGWRGRQGRRGREGENTCEQPSKFQQGKNKWWHSSVKKTNIHYPLWNRIQSTQNKHHIAKKLPLLILNKNPNGWKHVLLAQLEKAWKDDHEEVLMEMCCFIFSISIIIFLIMANILNILGLMPSA